VTILFHFFPQTTHKHYYLKTTNFYLHAAEILL